MKNILNTYPWIIVLMLITSCVSSKKYADQKQEADQLRSEMKQISERISRVDELSTELTSTKNQLRKTEEVLTQFYMKYEGKEPNFQMSSIKSSNDGAQIDSLKWKLNELQSELNRKDIENNNLKNDLSNFKANTQSKSTGDKNNLKEYEQKITDLNSEISNLNLTLDGQKNKIQELEMRITATKDNSSSGELATLKQDIGEKNKQIESLNKTLVFKDEQLNNVLKDLQNSNTKSKDKKGSAEILELKKSLSEQSNKVLELENQINNLSVLTTQKESIINEQKTSIATANHEKDKLAEDIKGQKAMIESLQFQLEESKLATNDKKGSAKLKDRIKDLESQLAAKENESKLTSQNLDQLKLREEKAKGELQTLQATLAQKNEELDKALKLASSSKEINSSIASYQSRLEQSEINTNNLQAQISSKDKQIKELEEKNLGTEDRSKKMQNLQKQIDENSTLISELRRTNELKSKDIDQLNNLLAQSQNDIKVLQTSKKTNESSKQVNDDQLNSLKVQMADMEGKLSSYQSTVHQQNKKIDSLQFVSSGLQSKLELESIALSNANSKLSISEFEVSKLRLDVSKLNQSSEQDNKQNSDAEIRRLNDKIAELTKANANSTGQKISSKSVPTAIVNKITGLSNEFPRAGVFYKLENGKIHVLIPQSFLFEGETVALKEQGSTLVTSLANSLKPYRDLNVHITGFGSYDSNATKTMDGSFRRANTILRLLTASGIGAEKVTVGARPYSNFDNSKSLPAGVEIMILAE
jgi:chromosome segregation ATPase